MTVNAGKTLLGYGMIMRKRETTSRTEDRQVVKAKKDVK